MTRAFVSVGSNIDPEKNVQKAVALLTRRVRITNVSTVYLTEPEGRPEQPAYYNCVLELDTTIPPLELKRDVLLPIENELGRKRSGDAFAARTIDLDLILYNDLVVKSEDLMLPDPGIIRRPFLAVPLQELAPELILPDSKSAIADIASDISQNTMKPLAAYTEKLRREIVP